MPAYSTVIADTICLPDWVRWADNSRPRWQPAGWATGGGAPAVTGCSEQQTTQQSEQQHVIDLLERLRHRDAHLRRPHRQAGQQADGHPGGGVRRHPALRRGARPPTRSRPSRPTRGSTCPTATTAPGSRWPAPPAIVNDEAKLTELWDTFTGSWLEGGPENPENILIEVDAESAEYWDAPGGSKVVQLTNLVKAKLTGSRIEGDNEQVDLG